MVPEGIRFRYLVSTVTSLTIVTVPVHLHYCHSKVTITIAQHYMDLTAYMKILFGYRHGPIYIAHSPALYHHFVNGLRAPRRGRLDVTSFGLKDVNKLQVGVTE